MTSRVTILLVALALASCGRFTASPQTAAACADDNKRAVEDHLRRNLGDPSDMEIVEWGEFEEVSILQGTVDMNHVKRECRDRFDQVKPPSYVECMRRAAEDIAERERQGKSKIEKEWLTDHNRRFQEEFKTAEAEWNAENERTRVEWVAEYDRRKAALPRYPGVLGDVSFRSRNAFGGKVLARMAFVIRDGKICAELSSDDVNHFHSTSQARVELRSQAEGGRWVKTIP